MQNTEQQKKLPLYTVFIAGLPSKQVFFYERAAAELNIYLKVEYLGCVLHSINEKSEKIYDTEFDRKKIDEQNLVAKQYYDKIHGENWFDQVINLAQHLEFVNQYKLLKKEIKNGFIINFIISLIFNTIFFFSFRAIFNTTIGIIACGVFTIIHFVIYIRKYTQDFQNLYKLRIKINNYKKK